MPLMMSFREILGLSKCLGVTCSSRSSDETTFAINSTTASSKIEADILIFNNRRTRCTRQPLVTPSSSALCVACYLTLEQAGVWTFAITRGPFSKSCLMSLGVAPVTSASLIVVASE